MIINVYCYKPFIRIFWGSPSHLLCLSLCSVSLPCTQTRQLKGTQLVNLSCLRYMYSHTSSSHCLELASSPGPLPAFQCYMLKNREWAWRWGSPSPLPLPPPPTHAQVQHYTYRTGSTLYMYIICNYTNITVGRVLVARFWWLQIVSFSGARNQRNGKVSLSTLLLYGMGSTIAIESQFG